MFCREVLCDKALLGAEEGTLVFLSGVLGYLRENPLERTGICCGIDACTVQSEHFPHMLSLSPPASERFLVFAFLVTCF